jgi:hypothetical protein
MSPLAPIVIRGLADSSLAADLADCCAFVALPQDEGHLRLRERRSLHDLPRSAARIVDAAKLEFSSNAMLRLEGAWPDK